MKLLRLRLENWRAVEDLSLDFADGVTLIEGPNEIGKSTLIAALHTLFDELDSSNKRSVKAVQPVGRDVPSRVEAEVTCGRFHFVFSKTYNRDRATSLRLLAPEPLQLTGRDAHQKVQEILTANVDTGLWKALTVEQGAEVSGVRLADSSGLARALDEAANTGEGEAEDGDLYAAAGAEYERYFTPRTGRSRLQDQDDRMTALQQTIDDARAALDDTERDDSALRRCEADILRLEEVLPDLRARATGQRREWEALRARLHGVEVRRAELNANLELARIAAEERERRARLGRDLADNESTRRDAQQHLPALRESVDHCRQQLAGLTGREQALQDEQTRLRSALAAAQQDEQLLQLRQALALTRERLRRGREYADHVEAQRRLLAANPVDAAALEEARDTERRLQLAIGKRDMASAVVAVSAEAALQVNRAGDRVDLAAGETNTWKLTTELRISIPGAATVEVTPPHSTAELEREVRSREEELQTLLVKLEVDDLASAIAANTRRREAGLELARWQEKLKAIEQDDTLDDLAAAEVHQQQAFERGMAARAATMPLPEDADEAGRQRRQQENELNEKLKELTALQAEQTGTRTRLQDAEANYQMAARELKGLEETGRWLSEQLAQSAPNGAETGPQAAEQEQRVAALQAELARAEAGLDEDSLEAAQVLTSNADDALKRAESDLQQQRQLRAVLVDRLERARADGAFERLQAAQQDLEELERELALQQERAAAARCLWLTLNRHRDATRRAYARPLREGIERLGRIVFGSDFQVELGEDWRLVSCTRGGNTIPFDDLSVGMREQLGILVRLAASVLVGSDGGAPLIIDDALGFSDPQRLETMGAAIAAAARETQIIVLTCFPGRFTHIGNARRVQL